MMQPVRDILHALQQLPLAELRTAAAVLGLDKDLLHFLGLPDTHALRSGPWKPSPPWFATLAAAVAAKTEIRLVFYPVWGWLIAPEQMLPVAAVRGDRLPIGEVLVQKRHAIAADASQYADLCTDGLGGLRLPAALLSVFDRDFEVFLDP